MGCAVAYALSKKGHDLFVLEKGPRIAEGTTSRNSGVIHAGIYYPPSSLKAMSCIRGKSLLYEWCQTRGVPHKAIGKWIVGGLEDEEALLQLYENAIASGATGLEMKTKDAIQNAVPGVKASLAIYSSETGIVDPYEYSRSLQIAAEENGAQFLTHTEVTAIERVSEGGSYRVSTTRGEIESEVVINAAGLYADEIAKLAGVQSYQIHPCRGHYFKLSTKSNYRQLIYPVKKKKAAGLGIHLTLALDGSCRLGPDVEWVKGKEDYAPPLKLEQLTQQFLEAASSYLEGITLDQITYDSCGIRPKLRSPTDTDEKDFVLSQDLPGMINLVGIESPGLTAALDLADRVSRWVS